MECGHCYFARDGRAEDRWCRSCGRSYRPSVNVYLGFVTLVYLVFVRYVNYCLSGNFLRMGEKPSWIMFRWARWPVDVQHRPEFILVLGGFLAVMVLVPVVVAILHGKRGGALLAAVALIVGPSWLVGALLFGCIWVAGDWRLKLSSKVGSALLACGPVWIFYLIASIPREDVTLSGAYYIPALVSIVMSTILVFLLLVPLKWLRWNARVAGIALCVLCVAAICSYKVWIGEDGLQYELLSNKVGLKSTYFATIPGDIVLKLFVDEEAAKRQEPPAEDGGKVGRQESLDGDSQLRIAGPPGEKPNRQALSNLDRMAAEMKVRSDLSRSKEDVRQECDSFLRRFPNSRHTADVLYTRARALDMTADMRSFHDPRATSLPIRYDAGRITHDDSPAIWTRLRDEFADSPYAAEAAVKLAARLARNGKFEEAEAAYRRLFETYGDEVDQPLPDTSNLSVFTDLLVVGNRLRARVRAERIEQQYQIARREYAFLVENRQANGADDAILAAYLSLSRFLPGENKRTELALLLKRCGSCPLADNLAYELAALEQSTDKRDKMLRKVRADYRGTDGAAHALLALAELEANAVGNRWQHLQRAIDYCEELLVQYPESHLARLAEQKKHQCERELARINPPQPGSPTSGELP